MTTLNQFGPTTAAKAARRAEHRSELAELLDRNVSELTDTARLVDELALDSLAMMTLSAWLEGHGVRFDTDQNRPADVGDLLSLLDTTTENGIRLSIRMADGSSLGSGHVPNLSQPSADPLTPVLDGSVFRMVPVQPNDVPFLYALAVLPENCFRWRYRGAPPSPDRFTEDLWTHVLVQYVVRRIDDNEPVGHVVAYGADKNISYAYVGALFLPEYTGTGLAADMVRLFMGYLFHTFPFRKLYLEIPDYNWPQLGSGEGRYFQTEGVLCEHVYHAGRYWDLRICAVYPDRLRRSSNQPATNQPEGKRTS